MTVHHPLPPGKYKLTIDDFLRLDETGAFGTDRTELLNGDVIIMNAEYRPHGRIRDELQYRLRRALEDLGRDLYPMSASVALPDHSMPLPDIVLTREPEGDGPIPPDSVALIVEVSASTLQRDAGEKASVYASAGIPEYWIVDVGGRTIMRMWQPENGLYLRRDKTAFGLPINAETIDGLSVDTHRL